VATETLIRDCRRFGFIEPGIVAKTLESGTNNPFGKERISNDPMIIACASQRRDEHEESTEELLTSQLPITV